MANNVHYSVNLDLDAGQIALLEKTMKAVETEEGQMKWKSWTAEDLPIYPVSYNEDDWYNWSCENIGAKWCHIEEYADDYISGYSAWSPPIPLVENLVQYIHDQVGGDVSAKLTYEDEFRNFIGYTLYYVENGEVIVDDDYIDGEDLTEIVEKAFELEVNNENFDWWEVYPLKQGSYAGEDWEPQQYADEVVYQYFDDGRFGLL